MDPQGDPLVSESGREGMDDRMPVPPLPQTDKVPIFPSILITGLSGGPDLWVIFS